MRIIISIFVTISTILNLSGQDLNGFKYVFIPTLYYQGGEVDVWSISSKLRASFAGKGFIVMNEKSIPSTELINNPCLLINCIVDHTNVTSGTNSVTLTLKDCNNNIILNSSGSAMGWSLQDDFNKATKRAFQKIGNLSYRFDPAKTPIINLPEVEKINETEQTLIAYFDSNTLDDIEGIYKSYQSDQIGYYKIGIKKYGREYKAVIIESEFNYWKPGEVKAVFESSSISTVYSTKWFMRDKTTVETFASMETPALLMVEFIDNTTRKKLVSNLVKMYPLSIGPSSSTTKIDDVKATGSGFIVSTDGIIATNSHVVANANKIEIYLNTDFGTKIYSAKILLKDVFNDVALLQINDPDYKQFSSLPYSIIQSTEIGEDVFTIGYPLNSIMGDKYKVTNGIISSNTGIKDDIRFLQITTPIQPGNSGGPLFNKDGNIVGLTTSKLDENVLGTSIENVNFAIKANYLINIYNMIPNKKPLSTKSTLNDKALKDQIKILKNYVCLIKVY